MDTYCTFKSGTTAERLNSLHEMIHFRPIQKLRSQLTKSFYTCIDSHPFEILGNLELFEKISRGSKNFLENPEASIPIIIK